MKTLFASLFFGALLFRAGGVRAAFQDPGYGARPMGMGEAFSAVANDANAALYNPAGAVRLKSGQVLLGYAKPFSGVGGGDVDLSFVSAVKPVYDLGAGGVSWAALSSDAYRQETLSFLGATSLNRWWTSLPPTVGVGVNLRWLRQKYELDARTRNDSVFSGGNSASALAVDAGLWTRPEPRLLPGLSLALVGKSLNQPDAGLTERDPVHRELSGGAAYESGPFVLAADLVQRRGDVQWRAGAEVWTAGKALAVRAGANDAGASAGFSARVRMGASAMTLDYAYTFPVQVSGSIAAHRVALGFTF